MKVIVRYMTWISSGHYMLDDTYEERGCIREVEKLEDLNEEFKDIVDVKVLET